MSMIPRLYILVRRDLNIPFGKAMVQVAHAMENVLEKAHRDINRRVVLAAYLQSELRTKICLAVDSEEQLRDIYRECQARWLTSHLVTDAGLTVFKEPTVTTLAIGPLRMNERPMAIRKLDTY